MKQYLHLLETIKEKGTYKPPAREGMPGTLSLFGHQFRHNLQEGFPILTTKEVSFKHIVAELLWFLRGDTNIKYLIQNGCNIWNEDAYNYYVKLCKQWKEDPVSFEIFRDSVITGQSHSKYKFYTFGDCGLQYGHQWRNFGALPKYRIQPQPSENIVGGSKGPLKNTWEQMISRCYDPKSIGFKNYGAKGVYVCDHWLDYGSFVNDVTTMDGWEEKENDWGNWQLDKDFKGDGFCYSPETCRWVNRETNMSSSTEKYTFFREDDNYTETTSNLRKFGRRHNVSHSNLSRIISGERKTTGGFEFVGSKSRYKGIDQITNLINNLKSSPASRRHIISAWNPEDLNDMALHPCHALFQFNCRPLSAFERENYVAKANNYTEEQRHEMNPNASDEEVHKMMDMVNVPKYYLDCQLYQRSADVFLGVPYNIASYALLTHIIAQMVNMVPGEYIHTFGDVHIYDNHKDQIEEQLIREPKELPILYIPDFSHSIGDFDTKIFHVVPEDFSLENYNAHPRIKGKLSTGLK